jgi:hypothetical protein
MWVSGYKSKANRLLVNLHIRRSAESKHDKVLEQLITDEVWHTWELSGIVPIGTTAVQLRIRFNTSGGKEGTVQFRKKVDMEEALVVQCKADPEIVDFDYLLWVECDVDLNIEYRIQAVVWNEISIVIVDYCIAV